MEGNGEINPHNPVYISYSWRNEKYPDYEKELNKLCEEMKKHNIRYVRDIDCCKIRENIDKFEQNIGNGDCIIVVLSDKYLTSSHTMREWHYIRMNAKIEERVFMIVITPKLKDRWDYFEKELIKKYNENEQTYNKIPEKYKHPKLVRDIHDCHGFAIDDLLSIRKYYEDYNHGGNIAEISDNDYTAIIQPLIQRVTQLEKLSNIDKIEQENNELKIANEQLRKENAELLKRLRDLNQEPKPKPNPQSRDTAKIFIVNNVQFTMKYIPQNNNGYYLGETVVTQELWKAVSPNHQRPQQYKDGTYPYTNVSYDDATIFITTLNKNQEIQGQLNGYEFCLPTNEEWINAASGGGRYETYSGYTGTNTKEKVEDYVNYSHHFKSMIVCANKNKPNCYGLYNMSGNVHEWCAKPSDDCDESCLMGGSYKKYLNCCTIKSSIKSILGANKEDYGFRLALRRKL